MAKTAVKKKYKIESTTPGFPELEKALFEAKDKIGWKDLSAFLVKWSNKHDPLDTPYCLQFWLNQCRPRVIKPKKNNQT